MGSFATAAYRGGLRPSLEGRDADYREDDTEQAWQFQALVSQHHCTENEHFRIQPRAHLALTQIEAASWLSENR